MPGIDISPSITHAALAEADDVLALNALMFLVCWLIFRWQQPASEKAA